MLEIMASGDSSKQPNITVLIDDEEYSLTKRPSESSALVEHEKEDLYGDLNLRYLVDHLKSVAKFIRVASYATGAAPPVKKVQEIRIEIYHLGNNISKLCDQSAITVSKFKSTSQTIMVELQAAYEYLIDGLEEMAMDSLSDLSEQAEKMANAADEMRIKFEDAAEKVQKLAGKTMTSQDEQEQMAIKKKTEQKNLEREEKIEEEKKIEYLELEKRAREKKEEYTELEDKEIEKFDPGVFAALQRMIMGSKLAKWRQKRIDQLAQEMDNRKSRQDAMIKQAEFLKKLENCKFDEIEYDKVANILHHAVTALKGLAAVMQKAVEYWTLLKDRCLTLSEAGIKKKIEKSMKSGTVQERLRIWTSNGFKREAVNYFAKWVAVYSMCGEYMVQIRQTQQELFVYITENPTREECRKNLQALCQAFTKDVTLAQETSDQLNSDTLKEIKDLEEGKKDLEEGKNDTEL